MSTIIYIFTGGIQVRKTGGTYVRKTGGTQVRKTTHIYMPMPGIEPPTCRQQAWHLNQLRKALELRTSNLTNLIQSLHLLKLNKNNPSSKISNKSNSTVCGMRRFQIVDVGVRD